jgi:hypothetical protein
MESERTLQARKMAESFERDRANTDYHQVYVIWTGAIGGELCSRCAYFDNNTDAEEWARGLYEYYQCLHEKRAEIIFSVYLDGRHMTY